MSRKKKVTCYSGIGGQAVLEGVMMKNKDKYAVAVRKPDGEIEIDIEAYEGVCHGSKIKEIPFIRGIFNFVDSMVLGMKCLNYSASFYEDADAEETAADKALNAVSKGKGESIMMTLTSIFAIALAIGLFILLPYFITSFFEEYIRNESLMAIIEGVLRIIIFVLYVVAISAMKDIHRLYQYHGAEHKCINCLERGHRLSVRNVRNSSRLHKRCGTSFMFLVLFISIILFFFIRVDNGLQKVILRILLIPVIAGISYEFIRLAGRSNNVFVKIISIPGLMLQKLTTKEPDDDMIEVAIASIEAVFDWREYLKENFNKEVKVIEDKPVAEDDDTEITDDTVVSEASDSVEQTDVDDTEVEEE